MTHKAGGSTSYDFMGEMRLVRWGGIVLPCTVNLLALLRNNTDIYVQLRYPMVRNHGGAAKMAFVISIGVKTVSATREGGLI